MKYTYIFLISVFAAFTFSNCNLRFVLKFISEGAVSPTVLDETTKRDMFTEDWSNVGVRVLTEVGQRMLYLLGTKDRTNYNGFLSKSYHAKEIYIRSGSSNATHMSADAYMQGLYPPGTGPVLTPYQRSLAYPPGSKNYGDYDEDTFGEQVLPRYSQVYPIHHFDDADKKYFYFNYDTCLNSFDRFDRNIKQDNQQNWLTNFTDIYGQPLLKILNINDLTMFQNYQYVYDICHTFLSDYVQGKELKLFTNNGVDLRTFNVTCYDFVKNDLYNVRAGMDTDVFLLNATWSSIADETKMWMNNRIKNDNAKKGYFAYSSPKLVLFSFPDYGIASILSYLARSKGVTIQDVPYASSLSFELNSKAGKVIGNNLSESDYLVNIIYNGNLQKSLQYDEFLDLFNQAWTEEDVRIKCSNNMLDRYGYKNATIVLGVLLGVCFVLLIITIICCCKRRNRGEGSDEDHHKVSNTEKIQDYKRDDLEKPEKNEKDQDKYNEKVIEQNDVKDV